MKRTKILKALESKNALESLLVKGWVRTKRDSKTFSFIELNDGSCLKNLQIIIDSSAKNYSEVEKLSTGASISAFGKLVKSPGKGQKWEMQASEIELIGDAPLDYPLQKKRHTDEFLRGIAHLRPRTNKYGAIFRIRSELSHAIHKFFHERGFNYIHTPILTGSDCEGAGDMFRVSSLNFEEKSAQDFFGQEAYLTVSGQLSVEMLCLALGDVYTFGPTFRAENSNTRRHAAEFWMIEPEMAFCDLAENMDIAQEFIQYLIGHIKKNCPNDLELFARFVDKNLMKTLDNICLNDFIRLPYREAIDILKSAKTKFEFEVKFGKDLQAEHEKYLTETHFKKPVIVYDYPASIKPFYMRLNNDNETVAAMDVLVPNIGEIIGGSQREERYNVLEKRILEGGLDVNHYWWYLDSRKYGSVPHSGFGLGFERLLMLLTGVRNIRDVIPFPRTPGSIEF